MDFNELCINCFKYTGGEEVCMNCGTVQQRKPKQSYQLFPHTILRGRYIIGRVINNGGMGIIYKAYDMKLENTVAIKEFLPTQNSMVNRQPGSTTVALINENDRPAFEKAKVEFIEEARTMAQFTACESIVRIYEYFEENETAYVVMEYLDGISLREFLSINEGKVDFDTAMSIIIPVMEALSVIHKEKIIHCNVCPDNIFICVNQHVKLIDFSDTKLVGETNRDDKSIVTKPGYTPPEQYTSDGKVGPYTDIYATGAVLYNMLSGKVPTESIVRAERDSLQKLTKLGIQLPIYSDKSIMKAMALREESRFKSIDDFINAVQGKKKADFPEVELKKKKIRRTVSIVAVFVFMIMSVVAAYVVKSVYSIIPTSSTEIEVWYIETEQDEKRWKTVAGKFNDFAKTESSVFGADIKINARGFSEKEYKKELQKAFEEGNAPDVYESGMLSEDENAASLETLYSELEDDDFNNVYKIMKDTYSKENKIAFCYDMPVLYTSKKSSYMPDGTETLSDLINYNDAKRVYEKAVVTNPDAVLYAAYCYGYDGKNNKDVVTDLYNSARCSVEGEWKEPFDVFLFKKQGQGDSIFSEAKFYIGMISEYDKIRDFASLNNFSFSKLTGKNTMDYYVFPEVWSINKNSEKKDIKAAVFLFYYLINNPDGQNYISKIGFAPYYLPLNKKTQDSTNKTFGVIYDNKKSAYQADFKELLKITGKASKVSALAGKESSTEAQLNEILK